MKALLVVFALLSATVSHADQVDPRSIVEASGSSFHSDNYSRIVIARNEAEVSAMKKCARKGFTSFKELTYEWSNLFGLQNYKVKIMVQCK